MQIYKIYDCFLRVIEAAKHHRDYTCKEVKFSFHRCITKLQQFCFSINKQELNDCRLYMYQFNELLLFIPRVQDQLVRKLVRSQLFCFPFLVFISPPLFILYNEQSIVILLYTEYTQVHITLFSLLSFPPLLMCVQACDKLNIF